ncbi:stage V sporulation protein B [Desmospora activa]|uniref:Stage V sporulation protein B n=1 Tax=Desmospora activa DSM 45169 TaxID=1121389 RepID=A0A2T4Z8X9_9BACL|nr:stage V sporulation protein B [Desmospora activa]PTM58330.1 stage V sporulation protein B [Desmospora activa DSM 45169]
MTKQTFLQGTLILVGAGFITKILGFVYRIALSRLIGDEGMGLFQMAFPILLLVITLTTAGLPVAISKLVSEAEATRDESRIRSILILSLGIVTALAILFTILVIVAAPLIANTLLTDSRALYALWGIAPVIPIVAISSVFRGYFQGRQHMNPYAASQIVEQVVRIFTVLMLARLLYPYGVEYAAAGAMFGVVIGEGAGMLILLQSFRRDPKRPRLRFPLHEIRRGWGHFSTTVGQMMRITIPVTASRIIGSLSYAVEPIVVSQSLALAGIAVAASTALYGQLEGMAIPLIYFPSFITYALSVSLVPSISEAAAKGRIRLVEHRLNQAIRLAMIVGAPCAILLFMLAGPLTMLLYHNSDVARLLQIMAPFAVLLYLQGPLAAVLQGLDKAKDAMRNSIYGAVIKTALIFLLGSQPALGIDGVVLAINCGIIIVTALHFISIIHYVPFTLIFRDWIKLSFAIAGMGTVLHFVINRGGKELMITVSAAIVVSLMLYGIFLILLGLLKKEDIERVPYVGKWLAPLFPR